MRVRFDLGDEPVLADVSQCVHAVLDVWRYAACVERWSDRPVRERYRASLTRNDNVPRRTSDFLLQIPEARVASMRLESPLEIALKTILEQGAPAAYGLAALYGFERAIKLLMDWQKHRQAIEDARVAAALAATEVQGGVPPLEGPLTEIQDRGEFALRVLARRRIVAGRKRHAPPKKAG